MNDVELFKSGFTAGVTETILNYEAGPERFAEFLEEMGLDDRE